MNWANHRECAPHDHGSSYGWINIITGESTHMLHTLDQDDVPVPYLRRTEKAGFRFFAPRGMIHQMGNMTDDMLVTLHVYSMPITGMKVYDLERCAACVVSDDCGAWWPEDQRQRLREIKLRRTVKRRPLESKTEGSTGRIHMFGRQGLVPPTILA